MEDLKTLIRKFEDGSLPKALWTHEAHLAVGCFYVYTFGKEKALEKIRINIKNYNLATGVQNTETSGYHESISVFWIWNIHEFIKKQDVENTIEQLITAFIASPFSDKNFPFEYYSKEVLLSAEARLHFIDADKKTFK